MDITKYERRRNDHVLRREQQLRELLDSSPFSDIVVNTSILRQHSATVSAVGCVATGSEKKESRRISLPLTDAPRRSERNVCQALLQVQADSNRQEVSDTVPNKHPEKVIFPPSVHMVVDIAVKGGGSRVTIHHLPTVVELRNESPLTVGFLGSCKRFVW
jgi:hypothetical protein